MIIYHAITNYHILCCILHKIIYNKDKKCTIYISSINKDKKRLEKTIIESKIFDNVEIFKEFNFSSIKPNDSIKNSISKISNYLLENNEINFKEIEEYNVCGDQYSLGIYLASKGVKYNYFEEACGILSQSKIVENNVKNISNKQYNLVKTLKLFGNSDVVANRYGDLSKQVEGYHNDKDMDFCIPNILKKLPKEQIKKIISIFQDGIEDEIKGVKIDLLLTQHFINLGFMTYDEQKALYTLLVDYFSKEDNKLVIKPHPSDIHGLYKKWFPDSIVLNRSLSSELLPYCINAQIDRGITASSTSILGLEDVNTPIYFDNDIEKLYSNINIYYIALKILLKILEKKDKKVYLLGCYKQFFTNLAKVNEIELPELVELEEIKYPSEQESRKIFIVDDLSKLSKNPRTNYKDFQKELKDDDIVIYINSNKKQYFYNENQLKRLSDISVIAIDKKKIKEDVSDLLLERDYMFVYSKNQSVKEKINNMQEKIILKNTGIELDIDQKDRIEMKTLEGILTATEDRLLETVKNNKKLKEENEKIKNSMSWKITKPLRKLRKK